MSRKNSGDGQRLLFSNLVVRNNTKRLTADGTVIVTDKRSLDGQQLIGFNGNRPGVIRRHNNRRRPKATLAQIQTAHRL